jgi:hypothetical protein
MAGQCLRGQPEAAWGRLHQGAPASSHQAQAPEPAHQAPDRWGTAAAVLGDDRSWGEGPIQSPQVESGRRNHLVELVEEAAASDSPKVATAMAAGGGRSGKAAAVMQIARGTTSGREEATGAGLGRFDRPRPEPADLAEPGGPAGPAGLLGQQARWARLALANWFKHKS